MQIGHEKNTYRRNLIMLGLAVFIVVLISLGIHYPLIESGFHTPYEVLISFKTWVQFRISKMLHTPMWTYYDEIVSKLPFYGSVIGRAKVTVMIFICGALMALSGSIFQMVFRNPMAAPTMLGVSTGVNIGVLILVLQFGSSAYAMLNLKYVYCYIGAVCMLVLVLIVGKLSSGKRRMSIIDLLLAGAIMSEIVGALATYFTYSMENDELLVYQEILGALDMDISNQAFLVLGCAFAISVIPMFFLKFSFNAVAFESDEGNTMGINSQFMKILTMVIGTIMIVAAIIHCGAAGMISLAAPFISRGIFGAEYRKTFAANMLIGGGLLVICKDIVGLIPFGEKGLPLGTVVDFVVLPIFVVIIITGRRIWS